MRMRRWCPPPIFREKPDEPLFRPELEPGLTIHPSDKIFAIGSCFARNVEGFLALHREVPSRVAKKAVPPDIARMHPGLTADLTLWHRYNAFSIRHSLAWALEPSAAGHPLVDLGDGRCCDPYAGFNPALPTQDAERVRTWIDGVMARVRECRIVILTLGLSEYWRDMETGLAMNCTPTKEAWAAYPGRFRFDVASCEETLNELEAVHGLLTRHCPSGLRIVVTVSPIPLRATFRDMDIVVANSASKAILRAAVDSWQRRHDDVRYFPSYEIILNSSPAEIWLEDFRHVSIAAIGEVVEMFLQRFAAVPGREAAPNGTAAP